MGETPGKPDNVTIISDVTEESIVDAIDSAEREAAFRHRRLRGYS